MLERMRQSSQSLLIYIFLGIIIAVFVVNFGPQSPSCDGQATGSADVAAQVNGSELSAQNFRYGYLLTGGNQYPPQLARQRRLKETVMDKLIERELLAAEAKRLGFRVSREEVEDLIAESKMVGLGYEQVVPYFQKDGAFHYDSFKNFVQMQLGMSPRQFVEEQQKEVLAARARELLRGSVNVSLDEVKSEFVRSGDQVNVEYVRFSAGRYEADLAPLPEEIAAYAAKNEAKLKETYQQRKFLYEKAPKERRLRQILVKLDTGAAAEAEAAAKKKADALVARLKKGEAFATVAKTSSEDTYTRSRGGDLGWRRQGTTALGTALEEKVWGAKDGEVLGPEKGTEGFYIVVAEGTREGDIPFDKVKLDLAEDLLRQERAKDKAKAEADAALAKAKAASTKTLKDLFPAPAEKPTDGTGAPTAEETGLFARRGSVIERIGTSPELAKAIFGLTTDAPFAGPVEMGGNFVLVKLKERKKADLADFDKRKGELLAEASAIKGEEVVGAWAQRRCQEVKDAKRIDVNRDLLRYDGDKEVVSYEPCAPPFQF